MGDRTGEGADLDRIGQAEIEGRAGAAQEGGRTPAGASPAGPHETPSLTDHDATAGTGSLPSPKADDEADAATG